MTDKERQASAPPAAAPLPPARIVVELAPAQAQEGQRRMLVVEYYLNGARTRHALPAGTEMLEIMDALLSVERALATQAQAKAQAQERANAALHNKVFTYVEENHGLGFALRTVGKPTRSAQARAAHYAKVAEAQRKDAEAAIAYSGASANARKRKPAARKPAQAPVVSVKLSDYTKFL